MKVLLVDDDEKITTALGRGLRAEGFTVDVERNGIDGMWRASEGTYDAIVLDIMMPGRNGFLVCADLRAADNWTPILMLTAKDGDLDEAEALDTGADDYLVKPFSFPVLVARLHALIRRSSVAPPTPSGVADLRIDPLYHRVWVGESEVTVTSREFDVLHFLVHRAGQMLSKQHILDGVWSGDGVQTIRSTTGPEFRLLSVTRSGLRVLVGTPLDDVQDSVDTLLRGLLFAVPVASLLLAVVVWLLVGRVLRPVEAIRSRVAGMSGSTLSWRVPEPKTQDEIARLARTMNDMLERMETADTRQRSFVADESHELRTRWPASVPSLRSIGPTPRRLTSPPPSGACLTRPTSCSV